MNYSSAEKRKVTVIVVGGSARELCHEIEKALSQAGARVVRFEKDIPQPQISDPDGRYWGTHGSKRCAGFDVQIRAVEDREC